MKNQVTGPCPMASSDHAFYQNKRLTCTLMWQLKLSIKNICVCVCMQTPCHTAGTRRNEVGF